MTLTRAVFFWFESYLFDADTLPKRLLSFLLWPLSVLYCTIVRIKKLISRPQDLGIPIVSVGNLTIGGSGKSPVTIALARHFKRPAVILRGYGRSSKGLVTVSDGSKIVCSIKESGDEAMMIAKALPNAQVYVCEDRKEGMEAAKSKGAQVVFLDDGFGKFSIKKLDILIEPSIPPKNSFCLPSGCYRYPKSFVRLAQTVLREGREFTREVSIKEHSDERMVLSTAIAKPQRLEPYLPKNVVHRLYLPDHSEFDTEELKRLLEKHDAKFLLITAKDAVKLQDSGLPLCVLELEIIFSQGVIESILGRLIHPVAIPEEF